MDPEQAPQTTTVTPRRSRIPLILLFIALVAVGAGIVIWLQPRTQKQSPTEPPSQPSEATENFYQKNVKFPPQPPEDDEVYSYSGQVVQVNETEKTLTITTTRGIKTILFTDATAMVRQIRPSYEERESMTNEELAALLAKEYPANRPVRIGDAIVAITETNVRGLEELTASKIVIIE